MIAVIEMILKLKISILLFLVTNLASGQFLSASIRVDGLTCSLCSYGVEKAIKKLDFVHSVRVDLNANLAEIRFKSESHVDIKELIKSVKDAGFSVGTLEARLMFCNAMESNSNSSFVYDNNVYHVLSSDKIIPKGEIDIRFVDRTFSSKDLYKKYKQEVEKKISSLTLQDSHYFVVL